MPRIVLRRNVLIFHPGALGDFVLSWPLALALGRVFAQSRVIYVASGGKGRLAERALGVEWTDAEAGGWHGLMADPPRLPEAPARLLDGAAWAFGFVPASEDGLWARHVHTLAPDARIIPIQARPADGRPDRHYGDFLLDQLDGHPVIHEGVRQMLRSIGERGLGLWRGAASDTVVLHPGSGSLRKNWPLPRYMELARRLAAEGLRPRFTLGEVELERLAPAEQGALESTAEVLRPATYLDLLDVICGARAVITNDSGPGHLAGIAGSPTLALFGPTDPRVWRPPGPRVDVLRHEPLDALEVDVVQDRLRRQLLVPTS